MSAHRRHKSHRSLLSKEIPSNSNHPLEREMHAMQQYDPAKYLVHEIERGIRIRQRFSPIGSSAPIEIPPPAATAAASTTEGTVAAAEEFVAVAVLRSARCGCLPRAPQPSGERPRGCSVALGSDGRRSDGVSRKSPGGDD